MQENRSNYPGKPERATGDLLIYFVIHNIISVLFFFLITIRLGIFVGKDKLIGFVFQKEFWELTLFQIFPISMLCSIIGRITTYYIIKGYYRYKDRKRKIKRATKRWSELNSGINKIGLRFVITCLITSFLFAIGLIGILQNAVFNEETILTLMVVYIGVKIGTYFFVRWIIGTKL